MTEYEYLMEKRAAAADAAAQPQRDGSYTTADALGDTAAAGAALGTASAANTAGRNVLANRFRNLNRDIRTYDIANNRSDLSRSQRAILRSQYKTFKPRVGRLLIGRHVGLPAAAVGAGLTAGLSARPYLRDAARTFVDALKARIRNVGQGN